MDRGLASALRDYHTEPCIETRIRADRALRRHGRAGEADALWPARAAAMEAAGEGAFIRGTIYEVQVDGEWAQVRFITPGGRRSPHTAYTTTSRVFALGADLTNRDGRRAARRLVLGALAALDLADLLPAPGCAPSERLPYDKNAGGAQRPNTPGFVVPRVTVPGIRSAVDIFVTRLRRCADCQGTRGFTCEECFNLRREADIRVLGYFLRATCDGQSWAVDATDQDPAAVRRLLKRRLIRLTGRSDTGNQLHTLTEAGYRAALHINPVR